VCAGGGGGAAADDDGDSVVAGCVYCVGAVIVSLLFRPRGDLNSSHSLMHRTYIRVYIHTNVIAMWSFPLLPLARHK
jgi:hypothetical protein